MNLNTLFSISEEDDTIITNVDDIESNEENVALDPEDNDTEVTPEEVTDIDAVVTDAVNTVEALESACIDIRYILEDIKKQGGVDQRIATEAHAAMGDFITETNPLGAYTKFPSATRAKYAVVAMENFIINAIKAIFNFIAKVFKSIWNFFFGESKDSSKSNDSSSSDSSSDSGSSSGDSGSSNTPNTSLNGVKNIDKHLDIFRSFRGTLERYKKIASEIEALGKFPTKHFKNQTIYSIKDDDGKDLDLLLEFQRKTSNFAYQLMKGDKAQFHKFLVQFTANGFNSATKGIKDVVSSLEKLANSPSSETAFSDFIKDVEHAKRMQDNDFDKFLQDVEENGSYAVQIKDKIIDDSNNKDIYALSDGRVSILLDNVIKHYLDNGLKLGPKLKEIRAIMEKANQTVEKANIKIQKLNDKDIADTNKDQIKELKETTKLVMKNTLEILKTYNILYDGLVSGIHSIKNQLKAMYIKAANYIKKAYSEKKDADVTIYMKALEILKEVKSA